MRARVRGIYATALTRLFLDADHEVVQASGPTRRRFDAAFPVADHDVAVETAADRRGVGIVGGDAVVEAASDLLADVAIDTFSWGDSAPAGAVFDGRVAETLGGGAVVNLGRVGKRRLEGYLPFDAADDYVGEGDAVRVQVTDPAAPWAGDRPELATEIRAVGGLATLRRGRDGTTVDTRDDDAGRELAGMTDLLDPDVPDGWGIEWSDAATDADLDALGDALDAAIERARELETALAEADDPEPPRRVATPRAGAWVWFGRESRFALDGLRRDVTTTMPGHHRTKAATEAASAGVDFVEALCDLDADALDGDMDFPFAAVTDQFGPVEGDSVRIAHGKPDGRLITLGRGEVTNRGADGSLTVRREMSPGGTYDALGVERERGDVAVTTFREGRWWYPTVYRDADGDRKGTYVNVCTPVECFPDAVRYVDLHVDVVKHVDGRIERVDDAELDEAVKAGLVSEELASKARSVASALENAL